MAKWLKGRYGFEHLKLPAGFSVYVGWDGGGYVASFNGSRLPEKFTEISHAKESLEQFAIKSCRDALAELEAKK